MGNEHEVSQQPQGPPPAYQPYNPGYPQQPAGSYPPPPPGPTVITTQPAATVVMQMTGNCPHCRAGHLIENFTACGIIWAFLCFPCGLICLFTMKEKRCGMCGFVVN